MAVVPVNRKYFWFRPQTLQVQDRNIRILNDLDEVVKLSRHEHFANAIPCAQVNIEDIKDGSYIISIKNTTLIETISPI